MGIATPTLPSFFISRLKSHYPIQISEKPNSANSMSQDYHHQGIFSFSNGFQRAQEEQQQHIAQQIRRDKLRMQGFETPLPLVAIGEQDESGGLPVYETAGMLSEMFNFPAGAAAATGLLENQMSQSYRNTGPPSVATRVGDGIEWYGNRQVSGVGGGLRPLGDSKSHQNVVNNRDSATIAHHPHQISSINADSAAAMQLFLMNPQPRSPSPSPSHPPITTSSTLHMLLPNTNSSSASALQGLHHYPIRTASAGGGGGGGTFVASQFTWVPESGHGGGGATTATPAQLNNPSEFRGVVEGQALSLSLSSSLQHLEAAKAEELRMGGGGMFFFNQGGGGSAPPPPPPHPYKNLGGHYQPLHLQGGGVGQNNHQVHVGFGTSLGVVNVLRNSKYIKAAQELLQEFCSVGRSQVKKKKFGSHNNTNNNLNPNSSVGGGSSSSSRDLPIPPLSAADRIEHQRRKVKLLSMLDEVDRRYNHYCEQMQMVVNSFDLVMGFGAAVPYTALAQKAMSRHFRCLKDAIAAQLKHSCELLGDKEAAGTSGVTKGETPRLRLLEQSLRQQRAFHQMGMMEQEAWRPQRGLPERSVNILRAWLFEHFLHPYPSDADKHLLARQTGLSRNQVSNWFINARVRLWKPMVEDMYQQESKDEAEERERNQNISSNLAQTPTPPPTTTITAATPAPTITSTTGKRPEINALDSDPSSLIAINTQCFSDNQSKQPNTTSSIVSTTTTSSATIPTIHEADTCHRGSVVLGADYGTTTPPPGNAEIGSTLIRFGTASGDVSLTLGLRHAGNPAGEESFLS